MNQEEPLANTYSILIYCATLSCCNTTAHHRQYVTSYPWYHYSNLASYNYTVTFLLKITFKVNSVIEIGSFLL